MTIRTKYDLSSPVGRLVNGVLDTEYRHGKVVFYSKFQNPALRLKQGQWYDIEYRIVEPANSKVAFLEILSATHIPDELNMHFKKNVCCETSYVLKITSKLDGIKEKKEVYNPEELIPLYNKYEYLDNSREIINLIIDEIEFFNKEKEKKQYIDMRYSIFTHIKNKIVKLATKWLYEYALPIPDGVNTNFWVIHTDVEPQFQVRAFDVVKIQFFFNHNSGDFNIPDLHKIRDNAKKCYYSVYKDNIKMFCNEVDVFVFTEEDEKLLSELENRQPEVIECEVKTEYKYGDELPFCSRSELDELFRFDSFIEPEGFILQIPYDYELHDALAQAEDDCDEEGIGSKKVKYLQLKFLKQVKPVILKNGNLTKKGYLYL